MQHNQTEIKKIMDQGMITRSIIESEVTMKKCHLYSEMAENKEVKEFFGEQATGLKGVVEFFKSNIPDYM